jgi:hypothetical protein
MLPAPALTVCEKLFHLLWRQLIQRDSPSLPLYPGQKRFPRLCVRQQAVAIGVHLTHDGDGRRPRESGAPKAADQVVEGYAKHIIFCQGMHARVTLGDGMKARMCGAAVDI